jgi:hypothetical protein
MRSLIEEKIEINLSNLYNTYYVDSFSELKILECLKNGYKVYVAYTIGFNDIVNDVLIIAEKENNTLKLGPGGNFYKKPLPISGYNESKIYFQNLKNAGKTLPIYNFDWEEKYEEVKSAKFNNEYHGFFCQQRGLLYDPFIHANFFGYGSTIYSYVSNELRSKINVEIEIDGTYGVEVYEGFSKKKQIPCTTILDTKNALLNEMNKKRLDILFT